MGTIVAEVVDTGEKRDARGWKRSDGSRRVELVSAWQRSGVSMASFAAREGVKYTTFAGWVQRLGRRRSRSLPVRFAEVVPGATSAGGVPVLEVRLADGTQLRGTNAADLAALVRALR